MDRARYPTDWDAISRRVRERASWCCEWCGIANGATTERGTRVVLTVHHIGIEREDGSPGDRHDKHDVRDANLVALCNRCHLLADLDIHMANAAATRRRKRVAAGQLELEMEMERVP